ncbi:hypothetical protein [Clostridium neonatale]|uniref:hypothetical protein n=1 Tax=Clostridium neonatale TaxID=137838 RepID=UPI003C2E2966
MQIYVLIVICFPKFFLLQLLYYLMLIIAYQILWSNNKDVIIQNLFCKTGINYSKSKYIFFINEIKLFSLTICNILC